MEEEDPEDSMAEGRGLSDHHLSLETLDEGTQSEKRAAGHQELW